MSLKVTRIILTLIVAVCATTFEACCVQNNTGSEEMQDRNLSVETLSTVMSADEVKTLSEYKNLKSVDLTGSVCYAEIAEFAEKNPHIEVKYSVDVGNTVLDSQSPEITLAKDSFDYDKLSQNLAFLTKLSTVTFEDISLEKSQFDALTSAYPNIVFDYTLTLFDTPISKDVTGLDLTENGEFDITEVAKKLALVPALSKVKLADSLEIGDVAKLQEAVPGVLFEYSFSLFGKQLSTVDKEVVFANVKIGNENEDKIRQALDVLDNCQRFVLDDCGLDYELLAKMREDYRGKTKIVWRVYYGTKNRYDSLTDDDTLRAVYNVTDETCGPMKYCEDVVYMDIGHNEDLTDLSFVGYMPKMEVLIASGCAAKELPGFEICKKMVWLELCFCPNLENIESLRGCESLRFVNLSYTNVKELDMLHDKPLERFLCLAPKVSAEVEAAFLENHPEDKCLTIFHDQTQPYGYGWHYDDHGYTYSEYYKNVVREAFDYDYLQHIIATKGDNFD